MEILKYASLTRNAATVAGVARSRLGRLTRAATAHRVRIGTALIRDCLEVVESGSKRDMYVVSSMDWKSLPVSLSMPATAAKAGLRVIPTETVV
jgi:hypothetical protein